MSDTIRSHDQLYRELDALRHQLKERERAEETLRQSEERYRSIVESQTELICRFRPDTTFTFVNDAYCRYFGKLREELIGRSLLSLIPDPMRETVREHIASLIENPSVAVYEHAIQLPDGSLGWQQWVTRAILDHEGRITEIQSVARDIAKGRHAEIERAAFARLATRLAAVTSIEGLQNVVREESEQLFGWDAHYFAIRRQDEEIFQVLSFVDTVGHEKRTYPGEAWPGGNVSQRLQNVLDGQLVLVNRNPGEPGPDLKRLGNKSRPSASMMFAPVHSGEDIIGILSVQSYTPDRYSKADLHLLQNFADTVAPALERIHAEMALRRSEKEHRRHLEELVDTRTAELRTTNESLQREIAERKRIELTLRESEQRYRVLVETLPDAAILTDLQANIVMVNRQAVLLYGASGSDEMTGKNALAFLDPEDHERARDSIRQVFVAGSIRTCEYTIRSKDGSAVRAEVNASLVHDAEGKPNGIIAVVRDVTERKRLQQELFQAQKLESIGTLAGGIAHDFGNLLMVITGNVALLRRQQPLSAKAREAIADIADAAERGAALSQQLLTYAQRGLQKRAPIDLTPLVQSVWHMLQRTTPGKIKVTLKLSENLPPILADPGQIEQVVMNLSLNAIQASEPPCVIEISAGEQSLGNGEAGALQLCGGRYVRLCVKDHGCGMDAATMDRMFEPFFTTKPQGRGMGLAATLGIIQSHQGQIRVDSVPDKGTTVSVWLPVASEAKSAG